MKKLLLISFASIGLLFGIASFTTSNKTAKKTEIAPTSNIDFKITNDSGSEFKYCVNGGHNYISKGSTKSFSYSVGQDFYYIEGSNCGKQWFEVTSAMSGKSYKLSELTR